MDRSRILARLLRLRVWLPLGVVVAAYVAASTFGSVGLFPPGFKLNSLPHSTASTEIAVGVNSSFRYSYPDLYARDFSSRAAILADMVASPEVLGYIARSADIPASEIAVDAPLWTNLGRDQQWGTGEKRARQIVAEREPYRVTLNDYLGVQEPYLNVIAQAPTTSAAARLAHAVTTGLSAYLANLQTAADLPAADRYGASQLAPVTVASASPGLLANVGVFVFLAVLALCSGLMLALSKLVRDLRLAKKSSEVCIPFDRSSSRGRPSSSPSGASTTG